MAGTGIDPGERTPSGSWLTVDDPEPEDRRAAWVFSALSVLFSTASLTAAVLACARVDSIFAAALGVVCAWFGLMSGLLAAALWIDCRGRLRSGG